MPVVTWTSPITGSVTIHSTFTLVDGNSSDGTTFSVDRATSVSPLSHLAGGELTSGGSSGGYSSSSAVPVTAGDIYYFSVGNGGAGNHLSDSTQLDVTIDGGPSPTSCVLSAIRRNGPGGNDQADVTVSAANGLETIHNVQVANGAVSVPTFAEGTTAPVIVTTTKSTQGLITRFSFDATDALGRVKHCT
jgi:hypothetical protein